jgi:hypothetical protein
VADITAKKRASLPAKKFAIPSKAKTAAAKKESGNYPIDTEKRARNALSRVSQHGTTAEKKQVRAAVKRQYPGIEQSKGSQAKKK